MAHDQTEMPVHTKYGHNDTHVLVQHNRAINNQKMLPHQARAVIAALQDALDKLEAHPAGVKAGTAKALGEQAGARP